MHSILQLDIAGNPSAWISSRDAISMKATDRVIACLGDNEFIFKGGHNRLSGIRSEIIVGSILLTTERVVPKRLSKDYQPPLTAKRLFARDAHRRQYCGHALSASQLTMDHVVPRSRGGRDSWTNLVTACRACNSAKRDRTPEEWGRLLTAVPFVPNWAEYLYLKNSKRIIAGQQAFLRARFPQHSRLL